MFNKLRTRLILLLVGGAIISILLVSIITNITVFRRFDSYMRKDQGIRVKEIVVDINNAYSEGQWSQDRLQALRQSVIGKNFDITIRDTNENVIFSSYMGNEMIKQHREMMQRMGNRMMGPKHGGMMGYSRNSKDYRTETYVIKENDAEIGTLEVGYFGPFMVSESELEFVKGIKRSIIYAAIISTIISTFLGGYFSKYMSKPIQEITKSANNIRLGKLESNIKPYSEITEIKELSDSINHLSSSLKEQQLLRQRLTSDVAHELRTPLAILQSHLEAIIDGVWEPSTERLRVFKGEVSRLIKLVEELKYLSDIESHKIEIQKEGINLSKLLNEIAEGFYLEFHNKGVEFKLKIKEDILIIGDKDKIKQILINLLSNALKFTEDGIVSLKLEDTGEEVEIEIEDTGVGIPSEDIPYIFERLYRGDKSRNRKTGGSGIGLTIVKKLVLAHGGIIEAESEENKGTKFKIFLPKKL